MTVVPCANAMGFAAASGAAASKAAPAMNRMRFIPNPPQRNEDDAPHAARLGRSEDQAMGGGLSGGSAAEGTGSSVTLATRSCAGRSVATSKVDVAPAAAAQTLAHPAIDMSLSGQQGQGWFGSFVAEVA